MRNVQYSSKELMRGERLTVSVSITGCNLSTEANTHWGQGVMCLCLYHLSVTS